MSDFTLYDAALGTLVLNEANGYLIEEFEPGSPDVRAAVYDRPGGHGVADESRFFGGRTISISGKFKVTATKTRDQIQQTIMAYLLPNKRPMLRWTRDGVTREIAVRVDRMDQKVFLAVDDFHIGWRAEPFWRGIVAKEVLIPFSNASSLPGATWPWLNGTNLTFGAGVLAEINVSNDGVVECYPTIVIYGDANSPTIENITSSKKLKIDIDMASDNTLEIDTYAHTVVYNDSTDAFNDIDFDVSSWWALQPGTQKIKLTALTAPAGTTPYAVVSYTELYM